MTIFTFVISNYMNGAWYNMYVDQMSVYFYITISVEQKRFSQAFLSSPIAVSDKLL